MSRKIPLWEILASCPKMNKRNWIRTPIYIRNPTSVVAAKIKCTTTSERQELLTILNHSYCQQSKIRKVVRSLVGKTKRVKSKHVRTANWVFACAFWWRGVLLPSWFNLRMSRQSVSTLQMAGHEQLFLNSKYNREQRKREKRASQPRHLAKTRNWELMIPLSTSQRW